MLFKEIKNVIQKEYGPALTLRAILPYQKRQLIQRNLLFATIVLFFFTILAYATHDVLPRIPILSIFEGLADEFFALFLLLLSLTFTFTALEAMHRSYYFRGLQNVIHDTSDVNDTVPISWEVATIVEDTNPKDITFGFIDSSYGQEILFRAGITPEAYGKFLQERKNRISPKLFFVEHDHGITLATYTTSIYKQDDEFAHFIRKQNITKEQLIQSALWVMMIEREARRKSRWWSRDNLGRIPGLGKTWSYGATYLLERYGYDMVQDGAWLSALMGQHAEDDEVEETERILARTRQSNALLVSDDVTLIRQKVMQLYHKIRSGHALPPLDGKRIFYLDMEALIASHSEKGMCEEEIVRVFNQAVHAGNIIIYIEYFSAIIASAQSIDVDIVNVLLPYFESPEIQIIIGSTRDGFSVRIERDTRIMQQFDIVRLQDVSSQTLLGILERRAMEIEEQNGITVTIPALEAVEQLANRYFPSGVMPDKAFDLLEEMVPVMKSRNITQALEADVEEYVADKTGAPVGEPTGEESEKLLNLEDFLHKRVVGQDRAVSSVSKALRRSRAGIGGTQRPVGSFLFLGPTGVGKTETAKALAEAMFGDETTMARLDMSEFQDTDALSHLIGSVEAKQPGRLATILREKPFGVLLLDEFEKSHPSVHDLFLQILDEGHFTDAYGKQVSAQNILIIATSNAGADMLWRWEEEGKDVTQLKQALVDHIIDRALFKPELLNRFDDIVIFHILSKEQVTQVARLQLLSLAKKLLKKKQVTVMFSDDVVEMLVEVGYSPQFGARPMRRAIKDKVEQAIANMLLAGTLHPGDDVVLTRKDIQETVK